MNFLCRVMLNNDLSQQIKRNFSYKPTEEQDFTIKSFADFLFSSQADSAFILKGYAGTGKTTLMGALVRTMGELKRKCVLLAPTGRAAKVFAHYAGHPAYTIHKKIYRQRVFSNETDNFTINQNMHRHTLFIIDEASMIANSGLGGMAFGTGRLLDDLVQYVYSGEGCRLMMVGDTAQLPPVGEEESPALSASFLRGYGLEVTECSLTQVVRQTTDSGILYNATLLRQYITEENFFSLPVLKATACSDVRILPGGELIEAITEAYDTAGMDDTMIICRSNKRANLYNKGIRNSILFREDELNTGDMLMVAKNNYYWGAECKELDFIANGDMATVQRAGRRVELYGHHFVNATLKIDGYEEEVTAWVMLDTLMSDYPAMTYEQNRIFYQAVEADYADIPSKKKRFEKIRENEYYNALQLKFAYAVTCHKAQGGQWDAVFIDQGWLPEEMLNDEYWRWLYTAITRAQERVYFVNFKEEFFEIPV